LNTSLHTSFDPINAVWDPIWPNKPSFGHQYGPRKPTLVFTSADKGASQKQRRRSFTKAKEEEELGCLRPAGIRSRGRAWMVLIAPRLCMLQ